MSFRLLTSLKKVNLITRKHITHKTEITEPWYKEKDLSSNTKII